MAALVLLAPGLAPSARRADAVVLVEVGDERPHVREFVEHHLAVGFARVYAVLSVEANESRRHLSVDEVNATLQSYPRDVVRVVPRSGQHNQQHVHHGTALLISRAVRDAGGAPLWICAIDADEYVTPVDPWQRVPSLLAMYEAAGQRHIGVEKLWFGGAHDPELERCVGGPLIARFTQHGPKASAGKVCFHSSVLPPPPPPGGADVFRDANGRLVSGVHSIAGLTQERVQADLTGNRALFVSHFKPQSWAEYSRRYSWNKYQQAKYPNASNGAGGGAGRANGPARWRTGAGGTVEELYQGMREYGSGLPYAGHLHRAMRACAVDGSTIAAQLEACGERGRRLCRADCRAAKRQHRCAESEAEEAAWRARGYAPEQEHPPHAIMRGPHASVVVDALSPLLAPRNGSCSRTDDSTDYFCALGGPADAPDGRSLSVVVNTDASDAAAICATPCARQLLVDPTWHPELLASFVAIWLGILRQRLWKDRALLRIHNARREPEPEASSAYSYVASLTYKGVPCPPTATPDGQPSMPGRGVCFVHVGKSGGGSITNALKKCLRAGGLGAGGLGTTMEIHSSLHRLPEGCESPISVRAGRLASDKRYYYHYKGSLDRGQPGYARCVATGRILLWVRDPVSRFLSTWHASTSKNDERRNTVRRSASALGLDTAETGVLDLNQILVEARRRDGGRMPGEATFAFVRTMQHGASGLATYLPNCSRGFIERLPLAFVGQTERMLDDWRALVGGVLPECGNNRSVLGQSHHFEQTSARRALSADNVAWLRAFYGDDLRCMGQLAAAGKLAPAAVAAATSPATEYAYWPLVNQSLIIKQGGRPGGRPVMERRDAQSV